jgi:hypothetical protein
VAAGAGMSGDKKGGILLNVIDHYLAVVHFQECSRYAKKHPVQPQRAASLEIGGYCPILDKFLLHRRAEREIWQRLPPGNL